MGPARLAAAHPYTVLLQQKSRGWQQTEEEVPFPPEQLPEPHFHPQQVTLIGLLGT